jgi:hypothetical protein
VVHDGLDLLAAEQVMGVNLKGLGQVRDEHRCRIDHGEAVDFRRFLLGLVDPRGVEIEHRLPRRHALEADLAARDIHRQPTTGHELTFGHEAATQEKPVVVGFELQIVPHRNWRHHDALLARKRLAHPGDAAEQFTTGFGIGEREQAVADFDREDILFNKFPDILVGPGGGTASVARHASHRRGPGVLVAGRFTGGFCGGEIGLSQIVAERKSGLGLVLFDDDPEVIENGREPEKRHNRHPGKQRKKHHHAGQHGQTQPDQAA